MAGFGDFVTNNRKEFGQFTNRLQDQFTSFTSNLKQHSTDFQARNQQEYADFQARSQQEISNFRKRSDDKIAEIKRKSAEAFEKLEKEYNDFIQGTPFVNCIPGWSFLECKQDEPAWWSCNLKPGITRSQMQSDVEAYCTQKSDAFEYDPLDDFEEPENEEDSRRVRMTAQVEELSPEDEVTAYAEFDQSQGAPYAAPLNNDWNTKYTDTTEPAETENTINPEKSLLTQIGTKKTTPKTTDPKTQRAMLLNVYSKYCDDEGYSTTGTDLGARYAAKATIDCSGEKGKIILHCYKRKNINQSLDQADLKHYCSPDTITNYTMEMAKRPDSHERDCNATEKKAINATACRITAGGKYKRVSCKDGYKANAKTHVCEQVGKQETNTKCPQEQLGKLNAQSGKLYYYAEKPTEQYCAITKCKVNYVIDETNQAEQQKCICPVDKGFEEKNGKCTKTSDKPQTTDSSLIKIMGKVVNNDTKPKPIKMVHIKYDEGKPTPGELITGANGRFSIEVLPNTEITFSHDDYTTIVKTYDTKQTNIQISLTPKTSPQQSTTQDLRFAGTVFDENGTPIRNVEISYNDKSIKTKNDGKFDIKAPQGTTITFRIKGYQDNIQTLSEPFDDIDIDMTPTQQSENADTNTTSTQQTENNTETELTNSKAALDTLYEQFKTQLEILNEESKEL